MKYEDKLRDPRWQKRRREILALAGYCCERCMSIEPPLHVHHRAYRDGAEPWEYADDELECLCENCHEDEHGIIDERKIVRLISARGDVRAILKFRGADRPMQVLYESEDWKAKK
jgi:5-methylcytosine-specific restriction endonuclease McrA